MHQSIKDLVRDTRSQQHAHRDDCIQLVQRYPHLVGSWEAWSEAAYSAQARPVYKGMTKEQIASRWLSDAIAGTLIARMGPTGLTVG